MVKKFVQVQENSEAISQDAEVTPQSAVRELTFPEAAARYACATDTPRHSLPTTYFDLLGRAKEWLEGERAQDHFTPTLPVTDRRLLNALKGMLIWKNLTDVDTDYVRRVVTWIEEGRLARPAMKKLHDALGRAVQAGPAACLVRIREYVPEHRLTEKHPRANTPASPAREVILAEYVTAP